MPYCFKCNRVVCCPCERLNPVLKPKFVIVATDEQLSRQSHFYRLAIATKALRISRRQIPNWLADEIFNFEGKVIRLDGREFIVEDEAFDRAFNDDGSFRWLSDFMGFAQHLPKQNPQVRVLDRLRLIDLAFRIAHPDRAFLIAQ